jgi:predicted nucleic acid-binding protein
VTQTRPGVGHHGRDAGAEFVFDSSALCHAALADRLDVLGDLVSPHTCLTTLAVLDEFSRGCDRHPKLADVARAAWLSEVRVDGLADLRHVLAWGRRLGAGERHRGEVTVLAYAEAHQATAIIDDDRPRRLAQQAGVTAHGTLWIIASACRQERLTWEAAGGFIDALRATGARFPCDGRGFLAWSQRNGLLADPKKPIRRSLPQPAGGGRSGARP